MANDLLTPFLDGLGRRAKAVSDRAATVSDPLVGPLAAALSGRATAIAIEATRLATEMVANPASAQSYAASFRRNAQALVLLERFGLAACERFTAADAAVTRLVARVVRESNVPVMPPVVVLASQTSYFVQAVRGDHPYNILFVPAADNSTLLGLPAIAHELGHLLEPRALDELAKTVSDAMAPAFAAWPAGLTNVVAAQDTWTIHWARELACDGIAAYLLGAAYAWQWLRLVVHSSEPPFRPGFGDAGSHPAAAARFAFVQAVLDHTGQLTPALTDSWATAAIQSQRPDKAYELAYPEPQLKAAAKALAAQCARLLFTPSTSAHPRSVSVTLNAAWTEVLARPKGFGAWEATALATLLT